MKTKSAFDPMMNEKSVSNFALKHMTHTEANPMFVTHMRDALKPKGPGKLKQPELDSPWTKMGGNK